MKFSYGSRSIRLPEALTLGELLAFDKAVLKHRDKKADEFLYPREDVPQTKEGLAAWAALQVRTFCYFAKLSEAEARAIPYEDIVSATDMMFRVCMGAVQTERLMEYKGETICFSSANELTTGEIIDLMQADLMLKQVSEFSAYPYILSISKHAGTHKTSKEFEDAVRKEVEEGYWDQLPVTQAHGLVFFYAKRSIQSFSDTRAHLGLLALQYLSLAGRIS